MHIYKDNYANKQMVANHLSALTLLIGGIIICRSAQMTRGNSVNNCCG